MKKTIFIFCVLCLSFLTKSVAQDFLPDLDTNLWVTDNVVTSLAKSGNIIYLGGNFTRVRPIDGSGAILDADSFKAIAPPLKINGDVRASVSDGLGGWYIGGDFTRVLGVNRTRLAHILPDNTLDLNWNPTADSMVFALAIIGNTVYVGGTFNTISGQSRNKLAAIDAATGQVLAWDAAITGRIVKTIVKNSNKLLIGGEFTSIGGQARSGIAAIDLTSGQVTSWNPSVNGLVNAIAISGDSAYIGGEFNSIGTQPRVSIGAVRLSSDSVLDWNYKIISGTIADLAIYKDTIFIGGDFKRKENSSDDCFSMVNIVSGFDYRPFQVPFVGVYHTFAIKDDLIYFGVYNTVKYFPLQVYLFVFELKTGKYHKLQTSVDTKPSGSAAIYCISIHDDKIFVGGNFSSIGGEIRSGLAAIDVTTGKPTSWKPKVQVFYPNIVAHANKIYIITRSRQTPWSELYNIYSVDNNTEVIDSLVLHANGPITKISFAGNTLFIGGHFTQIKGQSRTSLAAIDLTTGNLLPWNPNVEYNANGNFAPFNAGYIKTMSFNNNVIYIAGEFNSVSGQPRSSFAAIDAITGQLLPISISMSSGSINTLAVNDYILYLGGRFNSINGQPRYNIAAIDLLSGQLMPFAPEISDNDVQLVEIKNNSIYISGKFSAIGKLHRDNLASINLTTGVLTNWRPKGYNSVIDNIYIFNEIIVNSMIIEDNTVYLGGQFNYKAKNRNIASGFIGISADGSYAYQPRVSNTVFTYPNPTGNRFKINNYNKDESPVVRLLNNTGKEVWRGSPTPDGTIDISDLLPGLYHVDALTNTGKRWSTRVVKE